MFAQRNVIVLPLNTLASGQHVIAVIATVVGDLQSITVISMALIQNWPNAKPSDTQSGRLFSSSTGNWHHAILTMLPDNVPYLSRRCLALSSDVSRYSVDCVSYE